MLFLPGSAGPGAPAGISRFAQRTSTFEIGFDRCALHPALPLLSTSCKLASAVRATIGIESGAIGANPGRTVFRPAMPHAQPPSSTARPTPRPSNSARRAAKRQFDRNRVVAGKLIECVLHWPPWKRFTSISRSVYRLDSTAPLVWNSKSPPSHSRLRRSRRAGFDATDLIGFPQECCQLQWRAFGRAPAPHSPCR